MRMTIRVPDPVPKGEELPVVILVARMMELVVRGKNQPAVRKEGPRFMRGKAPQDRQEQKYRVDPDVEWKQENEQVIRQPLDKRFEWMKGQAGPGTRGAEGMMIPVDPLVRRAHVEGPMDPINEGIRDNYQNSEREHQIDPAVVGHVIIDAA